MVATVAPAVLTTKIKHRVNEITLKNPFVSNNITYKEINNPFWEITKKTTLKWKVWQLNVSIHTYPYFMNCFFVHSRTPNTWTPPPRNSASSLAQTRSRLLDAYKGCYRKLGCLGGPNQRTRDVGNTTSNLFVFRMLFFLSKIYSWIIGTCWRSLGWVEEEHIKTHRAFALPWLFFHKDEPWEHILNYIDMLWISNIYGWELDRHDMDLHVFL